MLNWVKTATGYEAADNGTCYQAVRQNSGKFRLFAAGLRADTKQDTLANVKARAQVLAEELSAKLEGEWNHFVASKADYVPEVSVAKMTSKEAPPKPKATKLDVTVEGKAVYAMPNGIKVGSKGHVYSPGTVYGRLSKGEARKVRKALYAQGLVHWAAAPRIASL